MKGKKHGKLLCMALVLLSFTCPFAVYGDETPEEEEEKILAPYFFIEGADPDTDFLPLKETDVSTTISGVIAETFVTQTYANEGNNPINASYIFPASDSVSIHGMKMQIGDQVITAKIQEREEAKKTFEEAKSEGKSASLLEQQRPNVFSMDVANIMPGDTIRIELHYTEMVASTEGVYEFVFPTVVGPRYASSPQDTKDGPESEAKDPDDWVASPYFQEGRTPDEKYNITVNLSTGVPITDISCKSHKIQVEKEREDQAKVTLLNPADYAGNRDFILDYKLTGQDVSCGLMLDSDEEENYFMLMVQPPERYTPDQLPPREYIFVLDVSGSMYGYPLDTAKDLIRDLISGLKPDDRFNLLLFSNASLKMSPESVSATPDHIKRAIDLIDEESGGGGTELAPALREALLIPRTEGFSRNVIAITDGYISGEKEIFQIINANLADTSFFSFGIGDSVNRYLIDGMAKAGQGEAFVVTDEKDAKDTANRFRTYVEAPLLSDINVSFQGFDAYDLEPTVLPTLFAKRPIILFGKWRGDTNGTIKITGKTGNEDYVKEISVAEIPSSQANNAIRYLWARKRIEQLTDYGGNGTDSKLAKKLVTSLGLKYSMMTPYTSFVAVTETIRNPNADSMDVNQPSVLPLHVSSLSVGGYTTGSEPGGMLLLLVTLWIGGAGFLHYRRKRR